VHTRFAPLAQVVRVKLYTAATRVAVAVPYETLCNLLIVIFDIIHIYGIILSGALSSSSSSSYVFPAGPNCHSSFTHYI
jgi:hypothetical protein